MGQKFIPELHDPNYRKAEGQVDEQLTENEAKQLFDARIAKLDAEDLRSRDVNRTFVVTRLRKSSEVNNKAVNNKTEHPGSKGRQDAHPGQRGALCDADGGARRLYESADQVWMFRLFPFI